MIDSWAEIDLYGIELPLPVRRTIVHKYGDGLIIFLSTENGCAGDGPKSVVR